jgi:hypothetical protein
MEGCAGAVQTITRAVDFGHRDLGICIRGVRTVVNA